MADLKLAAQAALYQALDAAAGVTAPVFQHVPDEQEPPYVAIGDMAATPIGGKDGGLDRIEIDVVTVVRAAGREFLTPHMTAIRAAIEDQALPAQVGVALSRPVFESDDDEPLADGQTYVGVQRFSLFAQPAD